jgi:HTH-type transcriptional regulator, sugar sensing transcriptional regulator
MEQRFLNKLKEFGLNSYEAKIWSALLSRGVASAGELSDISNVPRSRAYDVLESLEKKGFIVMKLGKPIKYIAVEPEEVLERVKLRVKEDADVQAKILDELRSDSILKELEMLYKQGVEVINPTDLSGSLRDRTNMYNNMITMINNAEKSVVIMTTAKGLARKSESLKKAVEKAAKRGVKVRIAAPVNKDSKKASEVLGKSAKIKHVDTIKARFMIVDNKEVTFALLDDEKAVPSYDVGVWVSTPFFAQTMSQLFEQVWKE